MSFQQDYKIYTVTIQATFQNLWRDEFGWVDGYGPRDNNWLEPENRQFVIVCQRAEQAKEKVLSLFEFSGAKEVKIVSVSSSGIDALLLEFGR
jgi:hypothetical protein